MFSLINYICKILKYTALKIIKMSIEEKIMPETLKEFSELIKVALYSLFALLNVNLDIVHIIMWLMLIDTLTGIVKSLSINKIEFTFKAFYIGIMTKFIILLIPMTLALMALGLGYDFKWTVDAVLRLIILSEGISILTNTLSIKDNKAYRNKDYLSIILHWVRDGLIKLFDSTINKKDGNT